MKKAGKVKKERAELTREVTLRFLVVMNEIIAVQRRHGGPCRNIKSFAASINANASVFSQYDDQNYNRNITLEMCCEIFRIHNVNMNWLIGGKGERFYNGDSTDRLGALEDRLEKLIAVIEPKSTVHTSAPAKTEKVTPTAKKVVKKGKK